MGLLDLIRGIFKKPSVPDVPEPAAPEPVPEPAPAPRPETKIHYWEGSMYPRETGPGESIKHADKGGYIGCRTVRLEWVSRETDGEGAPVLVRTPESHTETMPKNAFTAAGERYKSIHQLVFRWEDGPGLWARDLYGRNVLMVTERFPCFDSSDYLYEDRCFRWFLLCHDGKLTRVYRTDGSDTVTVTEDVLDLETQCWKEMMRLESFGWSCLCPISGR